MNHLSHLSLIFFKKALLLIKNLNRINFNRKRFEIIQKKFFLVLFFTLQIYVLLSQGIPTYAAPGDELNLPSLDSDHKKIEYLLAIKKEVPQLFHDAARYDIDLFRILDEQTRLVTSLKSDPRYVELFKRKKYRRFTFSPPPQGISFSNGEIKPEAILQFRQELEGIHDDWKRINRANALHEKESQAPASPLDQISDYIEQQGGLNPPSDLSEEINTQLVHSMGKNKDLLKTYNQAPKGTGLIDKMKLLREKLVSGSLDSFLSAHTPSPPATADGAAVGESTQEPSSRGEAGEARALTPKESPNPSLPLLSVLDQGIKRLEQSRLNSQLFYLKTILTYKRRLGVVDPDAALSSLNGSDLSFLSDYDDGLSPLVAEIIQGHGEASQKVEKKLTDSCFKRIQTYSEQMTSTTKRETSPITLRQVTPSVGIFRGCTGGDCSSQYSFPYPNDPHESVYFVEVPRADGQSIVKGYVSTTEVELEDGSQGLYVITISGSHMNSGKTELILRGLESQKERLGVKHILLPTPENTQRLINFPGPRDVYLKATQSKALHPIKYQSNSIRRAIEGFHSQFNEGSYDHMHNNLYAVIYEPKKIKEKLKIDEVDLVGQEQIPVTPLQQIDTAELLDFLIEMQNSNRPELIKKIMRIPEMNQRISSDQLKHLMDLVTSCAIEESPTASNVSFPPSLSRKSPLKIEVWRTELQKVLSSLGLQDTGSFLEAHPSLLFPGILSCNDALSDENISLTSKLLMTDLKDHFGDDFTTLEASPSYRFFSQLSRRYDPQSAKDRAALKKSSPLKNFMERMLEEIKGQDPDRQFQAKQLLKLIEPNDTQTLTQLIHMLTDSDPGKSEFASELLSTPDYLQSPLDSKVMDTILALKDSPDERSRVWSLSSIKTLMDPSDSRYQAIWSKAIDDPSEQIRAVAAEGLARLPHLDQPHLIKLIDLFATESSKNSWEKRGALPMDVVQSAIIRTHSTNLEVWSRLVNALNQDLNRDILSTLSSLQPENKLEFVHFLSQKLNRTDHNKIPLIKILQVYNPLPSEVLKKLSEYLDDDEASSLVLEILLKNSPVDSEILHKVLDQLPHFESMWQNHLSGYYGFNADHKVYFQALELIGKSHTQDPQVTRILSEHFSSLQKAPIRFKEDKQKAQVLALSKALIELQPQDPELILSLAKMLNSPSDLCAETSLETLKSLRSAGPLLKDYLNKNINQPDLKTKMRILDLIVSLYQNEPDSDQSLLPWLNDSDPRIALQTLQSIREQKFLEPPFQKALVEKLRQLGSTPSSNEPALDRLKLEAKYKIRGHITPEVADSLLIDLRDQRLTEYLADLVRFELSTDDLMSRYQRATPNQAKGMRVILFNKLEAVISSLTSISPYGFKSDELKTEKNRADLERLFSLLIKDDPKRELCSQLLQLQIKKPESIKSTLWLSVIDTLSKTTDSGAIFCFRALQRDQILKNPSPFDEPMVEKLILSLNGPFFKGDKDEILRSIKPLIKRVDSKTKEKILRTTTQLKDPRYQSEIIQQLLENPESKLAFLLLLSSDLGKPTHHLDQCHPLIQKMISDSQMRNYDELQKTLEKIFELLNPSNQ